MKENEDLLNVVDMHQHDHNCEHDHNHEEVEVVELFDEDGKAVRFLIVATLEIEEEEFAILANEGDEDEVMIFKVVEEGDEYIFESIADENELQQVIEAYNELIDEIEEE